MISTDPIADMLTRIRNGLLSGKSEVVIPYSKIKASIAQILKSKGYISEIKVQDVTGFKQLNLSLNSSNKPSTIERISKPGRRIYAKSSQIPTVRNGRGIVIVSTPSGIMAGSEAKAQGVGGELICKVW